MEFSQKQGPAEANHWCQWCYPANGLYYIRERRERKEHATKEEHRRDKQGEKVVKAVKRGNQRGEEDGNGGEHETAQKGNYRYQQRPG